MTLTLRGNIAKDNEKFGLRNPSVPEQGTARDMVGDGEVDMCADEDMTEMVLSLRRDRTQGRGCELTMQYVASWSPCR